MLSIKHNLQAGNAARQLGINTGDNAKVTEKLSSGYRINRSADDAAGLSISEKMRKQIRGLSQASVNSQDGISLVQTAEGALNEVHDMLQRANELTIKAANGTLTDRERTMVDDEIQKMKEAIDEVANNTEFNGIQLFPPNGKSPKLTGSSDVYHYELHFDLASGAVAVSGAGVNGIVPRAGEISTGSELADHIANKLVPNAVSQILASFPSLERKIGSDTIDMALDVSYLDGPGNTLAYAHFSYSVDGKPVSMGLKVDVSDFTDADTKEDGPNVEMLESTLAHELMHSVMQYTLTDGMSGRKGEKYPAWFVEGTAQLAGGGFPTNWNNQLKNIVNNISDEEKQKNAIKDYLAQYTPNGRPYGHGYLAAAYVGYLANGGPEDVTDEAIAKGMDKIFQELLGGKSLDAALRDCTGELDLNGVNTMFSPPSDKLVEFVRKLSEASKNGAGSVIAGGLGIGEADILGGGPATSPFRIDPNRTFVNMNREGPSLILQVGGEFEENLSVQLYQMNCRGLGIENTNTKTRMDAEDAINQIRDAIGYVSGVRSAYGSVQNRLEHTISNLDNTVENTTAAESRIRDTDMSKEMVYYSNIQIIMQAGQAMLAQANQQPQSMLSLLQ